MSKVYIIYYNDGSKYVVFKINSDGILENAGFENVKYMDTDSLFLTLSGLVHFSIFSM